MRDRSRTSQALPELVPVDGAAVRAARERAGLSGTAAAAACWSSAGYLSAIERGLRPRMAAPRFLALADALDVEPASLMAAAAPSSGD